MRNSRDILFSGYNACRNIIPRDLHDNYEDQDFWNPINHCCFSALSIIDNEKEKPR